MAQRRMIAKAIYENDRFTDLSVTARLLYTYMCLNADDDGMLTNVKQLLFLTNAKDDDITKLIESGYILRFQSGVYVIRHWLQMNKVSASRKVVTNYIDELSQLRIGKDETYILCQQNDNKLSAQYSIGQHQDSLGQCSTEQDNLVQDNLEQVDEADTQQNGNDVTIYLENENFKIVHKYYSEVIGNIRSPKEYETLYKIVNKYALDFIIECIDYMQPRGGRSVSYLEKVCISNSGE